MTLRPGRDSSEYAKALRAEVVGLVLLVGGAASALLFAELWRSLVGLGLAAIGALVFSRANDAYAATRGAVKAAAVRRPADSAPRAI